MFLGCSKDDGMSSVMVVVQPVIRVMVAIRVIVLLVVRMVIIKISDLVFPFQRNPFHNSLVNILEKA